jgi:CRP-like cAMP-binding protein
MSLLLLAAARPPSFTHGTRPAADDTRSAGGHLSYAPRDAHHDRGTLSMDVERLRRLDLFGELDHHDLSQVARRVHEVTAEPGDILMEQGDMPFEMLVIESGTVEVLRDGEVLAVLGAGDPVGEMSLLRHERRIASVRATTSVAAVAIRAGDLLDLEAEMPEVVADIRAVMDERQRRNLEAGGRD